MTDYISKIFLNLCFESWYDRKNHMDELWWMDSDFNE